MVYRVYVEKKEALANEARALLEDLRAFLGIQSLTGLRLFNRYDLEGISRELFDYAVQTVLSEPQLDTVTSEVPQGDTVFAVEYLPGQYDQRADSAAQCIQILSQGERPTVRTARVYVLEGELTAEQVEKVKASMSQDWRKDPVPFPSYLLTNNNANIRRVRQRIEELSHKAEFVGWTFPGGEAKVNEAENRLQLIFEDKPDVDTRQALKSEGFKWAPSQGAWQRQLNQNAIRAAARLDFLRPEDGKSLYQLQPFAKRAEKDVSR